jgi:hypothetical protein
MKVYNCLCCGKESSWSHRKVNKYCSITCQKDYEMEESIKNGTASSRTMKRYLLKVFGNVCSVCGISEWNEKPLGLELEHKNGNSDDNSKENVCLICPNCHSQTSTYKAKNIGNGRHTRRTRYQEGKSF